LPEYRSLRDRLPRAPTAAEVRRRQELEQEGLLDIYLSAEDAPPAFWEAVLQATHWSLASESNFVSEIGSKWWGELRWQEGWPDIPSNTLGSAYSQLIRDGRTAFLRSAVGVYVRLSAIEHLLDIIGDTGDADDFSDLTNEAADRFRVGIRLEGKRFVDITSQHLHRDAVRPTLLLLGEQALRPVDDLYRKGFDRLLAGDPAGAITASGSALEEMLRIGGCAGSTLKQAARSAQQKDWITPGVEQSIVKIDAFRGDSDAHRVGTDERELARLVLHLTGSLLLYLGRTRPNSTD